MSQKRTQLKGMLWKARDWCFHEEMINTVKNVINERAVALKRQGFRHSWKAEI